MKRLDLSGKRFGRLLVTGYSHSHIQPSKQKRAIWDALCDCGNTIKVSTSALRSKNTKSCGCYFNEIIKSGARKIKSGEANFNYKYLSYKARAKNHKKNISFELTKEQFRSIIINNCFYCGQEPSMFHTSRSFNGLFISNGIDRIDSNIGYTINNSVPCCKLCNTMKNELNINDFYNHIKRIYSYVEKRLQP